jgi:hypothetical protein
MMLTLGDIAIGNHFRPAMRADATAKAFVWLNLGEGWACCVETQQKSYTHMKPVFFGTKTWVVEIPVDHVCRGCGSEISNGHCSGGCNLPGE